MKNWTLDVSKATFQETKFKAKSILDNVAAKQGNWLQENHQLKSNEKGASLTFSFNGTKVGVKALTNNTSGYAKITMLDSRQKTVLTSVVDFYSKK